MPANPSAPAGGSSPGAGEQRGIAEHARGDLVCIPSAASRRIALIALLEQEIGNWRASSFYLPMLAFMIFCFETGRLLYFLGDSGMTNIFLTHAPWANPECKRDDRISAPAGADDCCVIACRTVTDDVTGLTSACAMASKRCGRVAHEPLCHMRQEALVTQVGSPRPMWRRLVWRTGGALHGGLIAGLRRAWHDAIMHCLRWRLCC